MSKTKVYIIGSKGVPARYGGFETFVDNLISHQVADIDYVVTGMGEKDETYDYKGAHCVQFKTGSSVTARMLHTISALRYVLKDARATKDTHKILYILGCRAGIFLPVFRPLLKRAGVTILANPDGAEWKRAKWNFIAKQIVMLYETLLIKFSDVIVCDAQAILELVHKDFSVPKEKMTFIAYGSEIYNPPKKLGKDLEAKYQAWLKQHSLRDGEYYLIVGRFVPENNYELIIREFMASNTKADLAIISNVENSKFYDQLVQNTGLLDDSRIKFVGTLYDQDVMKVVRSHARAYLHGHEVGGTNPSLLEALGLTKVNLVYGVSFNKEVAGDAGLYFTNKQDNLAKLIESTDNITQEKSTKLGIAAKKRITEEYSWRKIVGEYEDLFEECRSGNESSSL